LTQKTNHVKQHLTLIFKITTVALGIGKTITIRKELPHSTFDSQTLYEVYVKMKNPNGVLYSESRLAI
jgi:hypothetical protein